jgi:iron complex outermembrane receptor protein
LLQNIGAIDTKGLDLTVGWSGPETSFGTFGVQWVNVFLIDYTEHVPATVGFTQIERDGTERGSPDQAYPEYKFSMIFDWVYGSWSAAFTTRYISDVTESQGGNKLGDKAYNDLQVTWSPEFWRGNAGVTLGINNMFGTKPPGCVSCGLNNFDPTTYEASPQTAYVRLTYEM